MISRVLFVSVAVFWQRPCPPTPRSDSPAESGSPPPAPPSRSRPPLRRGYSDLALAFARRARETSDPAYYRQADEALDRALELAPGDFEAARSGPGCAWASTASRTPTRSPGT